MTHARLIPALITPFTLAGELDLPSFEALAAHLLAEGCDGLLVNGTTGEAPTLSMDEKTRLVKTAQAVIGEKTVPLIAGIGSNSTQATVRDAQTMTALGVTDLLVVVPYYNKPSQAGMVEHFSAVAQAAPSARLIIYNIPSRCGVLMHAETMARLHQAHPNIIGVKQSHPDMDAVSDIARLLPADTWHLWSGDDSLTLPMMALGARGVISVAAHVAAQPMRRLIDAFLQGQLSEARHHHLRLMPLFRDLFFLPNPTVVKTLLAELGYCELSFRSPMIAPDAGEHGRIQRLLAQYPDDMLLATAARKTHGASGSVATHA